MKYYKDYIKELFLHRRVHFVADCIVKIDITGMVVDVENSGSELIYVVDIGNRLVKIGENTSKLRVEIL